MPRCALYYYTGQKHCRYVPRKPNVFKCLTIDVFGALPESGENIGLVMLKYVFGRNNSTSIDELIILHRLRWLDYVFRMPVDRLPRRVLFAQPREGWKRARGSQTMTWQRSIKAITSKLR
ncbi:hypothetical protein CLF_111996 [Clonorchis sinensis]|uniref:Uncharacterized protein n=1 Tax=Clonorchis sinensis TaxID=79923 RepID=G7YVN3_CLOSI|nr:hypothetical protein CLF_111996 [Clonorchis sinensis]